MRANKQKASNHLRLTPMNWGDKRVKKKQRKPTTQNLAMKIFLRKKRSWKVRCQLIYELSSQREALGTRYSISDIGLPAFSS